VRLAAEWGALLLEVGYPVPEGSGLVVVSH